MTTLTAVEFGTHTDTLTLDKLDGLGLVKWAKRYARADGPPEIERISPNFAAVYTILSEDPKWRGRFRLNEMTHRVEVCGLHGVWSRMTDATYGAVRMALANAWRCFPTEATVAEAITSISSENAHHPVQRYLLDLEWDGVPRIDTWLSDYGGVEPSPLVSVYAAKTLLSGVARAFQPGCKVDSMLLIQGPQRCGKSTIVRMLAKDGEWFTDTPIDVKNHKDAAERISGPWIVEWGEMTAIRKADINAVKAFISAQVDRYRRSYGREMEDHPRSCIFIGTANDYSLLNDPTGSRRFMGVSVTQRTDLDGFERVVDQLWAEAVHRYGQGETWHLTREQTEHQAEANRLYETEDEWAVWCSQALKSMTRQDGGVSLTSVCQAVRRAESIPSHVYITSHISRAMMSLGWTKRHLRGGNLWFPPARDQALL